MIAHVAEASERKGRVVLHAASADVNPLAIEAAMRIAAAFKSELESLFVEDAKLFDVAGFPFASQISLSGRRREPLTREQIAAELKHLASALHRRIAALAAKSDVPFKATVVRSDPIDALARACRENGPWNIVALAETLTRANADRLRQLIAAKLDATGFVVVGRNAQRAKGPTLVAIGDMAHLEPGLRAAERLQSEPAPGGIQIVLVGASADEAQEMENQARLIIGPQAQADLVRLAPRFGSPLEVAETLRKAQPGFVITRFDGVLAPSDEDLQSIIAMLECPLFLMR